eukprot:6908988-Pyramimonas_sp.AAC.1
MLIRGAHGAYVAWPWQRRLGAGTRDDIRCHDPATAGGVLGEPPEFPGRLAPAPCRDRRALQEPVHELARGVDR